MLSLSRHAGRRRLASIGIIATMLAALCVVAPTTASAGTGSMSISTTKVAAARDYATSAFADPWDFSNPEDHRLGANAQMRGLTGQTISGGKFSAQAAGGSAAKLIMVDTYAPNALPWGRDGALAPIDANRYRRASIRLYSDPKNSYSTAWLQWMNCGKLIASCLGGQTFTLEPGWHTYDFKIRRNTNTVAWAGWIKGLLLTPTQQGGVTKIDWIRLYEPAANHIRINTGVAASTPIYWDTDRNRANNTSSNPNWGLVGTATGGSIRFDPDQFPAGTYHFFRKAGSGAVYTSPLVIDARPAPVVLDPDLAGGSDYATVVRGDSWDFSNQGDVSSTRNTTAAVSGGVLRGVNTGPAKSDPGVQLATGAPIDGSKYHRLSIRGHYEGAFSLSGAPGGGMNARVAWRQAGSAASNVSEDIVVYPGWNDIVIDLATSPSAAITDSGGGLGWAGQRLDLFRFDPHEDAGARRWAVDEIRLAADDRGEDQFNIRFEDKAWEPGTTATIYSDDNRGGFNGRLIDTVSVQSGVNTYRWRPTNDFGTKWIYVVMRDPAGNQTSTYSTGPVQMVKTSLDAAPSAFTPLSPTRILDTRGGVGAPKAKLGPGGIINLQVTGRAGIPANATTAVLNVTATEASGEGFVTVWPTGLSRPTASNLNLERVGQTIPNLVTAPIGNGGRISLFSQQGTHLVADVLGYYTPKSSSTSGRFVPVTPARLADTRATSPIGKGAIRTINVAGHGGVPARGASAVVLNVTATETTDAGFLTVWPTGKARPLASNLNVGGPGETIPNQVIVPLGKGGSIDIFALTQSDVVVDVSGWFTDSTAPNARSGLFVPMLPKRLIDTRAGGAHPRSARSNIDVGVAARSGIPANAVAATLNVTATETLDAGYVTVWPSGVARPLASNLNIARPSQTIPNHVTTPLGGRTASIFTQSGGHFVADVSGYYTP